jgi:2C-methyl-D-erythritol 2,4-cyclodiphosphate synthase
MSFINLLKEIVDFLLEMGFHVSNQDTELIQQQQKKQTNIVIGLKTNSAEVSFWLTTTNHD